jgi:uncharacterized protein (DUF1810 family)
VSLQRFVDAQDPVYDQVVAELRAGRKRSHWMWFVFPQLVGLGFSGMARRYGITGLEEARGYLAHPVLGPRLRGCVALLMAVPGKTAHEILGSPDDLKLRSCLTLFRQLDPWFQAALDRFYGGEADARTLELLERGADR